MPIPILRFPYLALNEVIKEMELPQQFILSLCSKQAKWAVKNHRNKSDKWKMRVAVDNGIDITLRETRRDKTLVLTVREMREALQRGWRSDQFEGIEFEEDHFQIRSLCEDVESGTRALLEHLSDLFCTRISFVPLEDNRFFWILDVIENLQGPESYGAEIDDRVHRLTDEQFRHLLVDLNPSSLSLGTEPSTEFRVANLRKKYEDFALFEGAWMTIDNLLTMDCLTLQIKGSQTFTVAEMNRFLRHLLIDGGAPRLMEFESHLENDTDTERILDGVRHTLTSRSGRQQFEDDGDRWKFSGILTRLGRGSFVSIQCFKYDPPTIYIKRIGQ